MPCNTSLKSLEDLNFIGILDETLPSSSVLTSAAVALLKEELKKIGVEWKVKSIYLSERSRPIRFPRRRCCRISRTPPSLWRPLQPPQRSERRPSRRGPQRPSSPASGTTRSASPRSRSRSPRRLQRQWQNRHPDEEDVPGTQFNVLVNNFFQYHDQDRYQG